MSMDPHIPARLAQLAAQEHAEAIIRAAKPEWIFPRPRVRFSPEDAHILHSFNISAR